MIESHDESEPNRSRSLSVAQLAKLPPLHRGPLDRMLVCQALQYNLTIATVDSVIRAIQSTSCSNYNTIGSVSIESELIWLLLPAKPTQRLPLVFLVPWISRTWRYVR
jgi:hypothetical protein